MIIMVEIDKQISFQVIRPSSMCFTFIPMSPEFRQEIFHDYCTDGLLQPPDVTQPLPYEQEKAVENISSE